MHNCFTNLWYVHGCHSTFNVGDNRVIVILVLDYDHDSDVAGARFRWSVTPDHRQHITEQSVLFVR